MNEEESKDKLLWRQLIVEIMDFLESKNYKLSHIPPALIYTAANIMSQCKNSDWKNDFLDMVSKTLGIFR